MTTTPSQLITLCLRCLQSYDDSRITIDTHIQLFLGATHYAIADDSKSGVIALNDSSRHFIELVCTKCYLHDKLLQHVVDVFYTTHHTTISRGQRILYTLLSCITLLLLKDLQSVALYKQLCYSLPTHQVLPFIQFYCSPPALLREVLLEYYAPQHVDEVLLQQLAEHQPLFADMEQYMLAEMSNTRLAATDTPTLTIPQPFNLTVPTLRELPSLIAISSEFKAQPVDPAIYGTSLDELERERLQRRAEVIARTKAEMLRAKTPVLTSRARATQRISQRTASAHQLSTTTPLRFRAQPAPKFDAVPAPSTTTTTILREELLYRRVQQQKQHQLAIVSQTLKDDSEYQQWKQQCEAEDAVQQQQLITQRKIENEQSLLNAMKAIRRQQKQNTKLASEMNHELQLRQHQLQLDQYAELQRKQQAAKELSDELKAVPLAKCEVTLAKQKDAELLKQQKMNDAAEAEQRRVADLAEKQQLIKRIQAMQMTSHARTERLRMEKQAAIDNTSSSGQMLLSEMSLVELRERLRLIQIEEQVQVEEKRQQIQVEKQKKSAVLDALVKKHRNMHNQRNDVVLQEQQQRIAEALALAQQQLEHSQQQQHIAASHIATKQQKIRAEAAAMAERARSGQAAADKYAAEKVKLAELRQTDLQKASQRDEALQRRANVQLEEYERLVEQRKLDNRNTDKQRVMEQIESIKKQRELDAEERKEQSDQLAAYVQQVIADQAMTIKTARDTALIKRQTSKPPVSNLRTRVLQPASALQSTLKRTGNASTLTKSLQMPLALIENSLEETLKRDEMQSLALQTDDKLALVAG